MNLFFTFTSYQEIRDTRMSTPSESGSKPPFGESAWPSRSNQGLRHFETFLTLRPASGAEYHRTVAFAELPAYTAASPFPLPEAQSYTNGKECLVDSAWTNGQYLLMARRYEALFLFLGDSVAVVARFLTSML
jgi:hypothetical protein